MRATTYIVNRILQRFKELIWIESKKNKTHTIVSFACPVLIVCIRVFYLKGAYTEQV